MTAPLLNLPIFASAAPGGGQPAAAGGAATGFEALMAAFFATGEAEAGALGAGEVTDEGMSEDAADALLSPDAAALPAVDTQTMAALLAVTPQPQAATTENESLPVSGGAPPPAFTPLLAQEVPAAVTPEADAAATDPQDTLLAPPVAEDGEAAAETKLLPPGLEKPRDPKVTAAADHAKPQGAPPAHAAAAQAALAAQAAPPPALPTAAQSAADPLVQAEAAASQVEVPAEPVDEAEPVRPGKSETGRRNAAQPQTQAAAPVDSAADVAPPVPAVAANTEGSGEPNLAIEGKGAAVTTPRDAARPEAPDAQGHGSTAAGAQQAAGPIGEAPLPVRGSPETVAQLAAQIIKKLEGRSTHFDVELNPAGLGKVNVSIEIGAQGKMTAAMSFDTPHAAAELRARSGELQKVLEQAGFDLSGGGLSFDVAGDRGQGRGDLNQQQQQQQDAVWRGRAFQAVLETADGAAEAAATAALHLQRRSTTGVDVRV